MASQIPDIDRLDRALSCPIEATTVDYPMSACNLLYECWATLLYKYLPDPMIVNLLLDWQQTAHRSIYMTADECAEEELARDVEPEPHNQFYLGSLSADEIDGFIKSLEGSRSHFGAQDGPRVREDIGSASEKMHPAPEIKWLCGIWLDEEFDRMSKWLRLLRVVEGSQREKHWPPPHIKTQHDLIVYSIKKPSVGWLNPGTDPAELRRFALAALAIHFFCTLKSKTDEYFVSVRVNDFLDTWSEHFEQGTFRLGVTHTEFMGMAAGEKCRNVVYDIDPSSMQFHCFPVASFPQIRATFMEGQLDL